MTDASHAADDTAPAEAPAETAPEERIGPDVLHSEAHFERIRQMAKIMGGGTSRPPS